MRSGERAPVVAPQLPFANHVHDLDAAKDDACATEGFESEHPSSDALDRPVVLLNDVVEVLTLPNRYRRVMLDVIAVDARGVSPLWSIVMVVGSALFPMARVRNRCAAARSRLAVSRKSMVLPALFTAR